MMVLFTTVVTMTVSTMFIKYSKTFVTDITNNVLLQYTTYNIHMFQKTLQQVKCKRLSFHGQAITPRPPSFSTWFNPHKGIHNPSKHQDPDPDNTIKTNTNEKTLLERLNVFNFKFPKRIQYMSDLHLEENIPPKLLVSGEYLVLAGDIGDPFSRDFQEFIDTVCSKYRHVFYVAGNREYYFGSLNAVNLQLTLIASNYKNLHFLNKSVFDLGPDVRIIGTTLWSNMNDMVSLNINDFSNIRVNNTDFMTPQKHRKLHKEAVQFLEDQLAICKKESKQAIVVTHHAGHLCMLGKYTSHMNNSAYATDLSRLFEPPLVAWISGHTHENVATIPNPTHTNIKCVSNCLGNGLEQVKFDSSAYITIYM